jgi:SAM-dependent methyltransferase
MKDHLDGFGREIYDHFKGKAGFEIVERDDGYVATGGGPASYLAGFKDWPLHQRRAVRYARGRALDIGCGAGRVALHLQRKGLDVVGIDTSPLAVKVCRLRGVKKVHLLPIAQVRPDLGEFDTFIMMGNNFGLFESFETARRLLRRFHRMSSARARIIAESLDPRQTTEPAHLAYQRRNRRRGRMPGQIRIRIRYKQYATPWFDYLLVSEEEMKRILKGTGWRLARVFRGKGGRYAVVIERE